MFADPHRAYKVEPVPKSEQPVMRNTAHSAELYQGFFATAAALIDRVTENQQNLSPAEQVIDKRLKALREILAPIAAKDLTTLIRGSSYYGSSATDYEVYSRDHEVLKLLGNLRRGAKPAEIQATAFDVIGKLVTASEKQFKEYMDYQAEEAAKAEKSKDTEEEKQSMGDNVEPFRGRSTTYDQPIATSHPTREPALT